MTQELEQIEKQIAALKQQMEELSGRTPENKISMVVFSGDLDNVLASVVIAVTLNNLSCSRFPLLKLVVIR